MQGQLKGRSAIITGASQGLGLAIAKAYVDAGASVFLCARDEEVLRQAASEVAALAQTRDQKILFQSGDVSRQEDVKRMFRHAIDAFGSIQILVNNAGVYGPKGPAEDCDLAEWWSSVEINLLGSVRTTCELLPHFKENKYGKVVQISGGGATKPLPFLSAYAASKAAIVRFMETVAEEVRGYKIDLNAVAPGFLDTRLLDEVLNAGPEKVGQEFFKTAQREKIRGGTPLSKGAELCVYLGSEASDGITGKLLAAVWDPWPTLAEHREELQRSDVYTLRRIVPKDRGLSWGE